MKDKLKVLLGSNYLNIFGYSLLGPLYSIFVLLLPVYRKDFYSACFGNCIVFYQYYIGAICRFSVFTNVTF